jgi:hypothetical protein
MPGKCDLGLSPTSHLRLTKRGAAGTPHPFRLTSPHPIPLYLVVPRVQSTHVSITSLFKVISFADLYIVWSFWRRTGSYRVGYWCFVEVDMHAASAEKA